MTGLEDLPVVLTVREAAAVLRIGRNHTYELIAQGEIPALRLGRRLVIPRTALLRLLSAPGAEVKTG